MNPTLKPTPTDSGIQLKENLRRQLECAQSLLGTLEQEREALRGNDLTTLEQISLAKSSAAQMLGELGAALNHLRISQNAPNMRQYLSRFEAASGMSVDWQQLLEMAGRCQESNRENAVLLEARHNQVRIALRSIQGEAAPATYGRSGPAHPGLTPRNLGMA